MESEFLKQVTGSSAGKLAYRSSGFLTVADPPTNASTVSARLTQFVAN